METTCISVETVIGPLTLIVNAQGAVTQVLSTDRASSAKGFETMTPSWLSAVHRLAAEPTVDVVKDIPLALEGLTEFQKKVLEITAKIPSGQVLTYAEIAERAGRPGAVRAVGTALARNPVPWLIPCHRVIRSDGTIGQYSLGGSENKSKLLAAEKQYV